MSKTKKIIFVMHDISKTVKHKNGNDVNVTNIVWDYKACECLTHMHLQKPNYFEDTFFIHCDDIKFKCMSPNAQKPTENKIQKCLQNMQDGKCPYKIARQIFTNIPNKKSR
ncbi:MAG: hypothetical protein J5620_03995 [Alphaproteobacteria bacterium]|nr:hypothetical protein [Alphaproteobacteria bacterium]